MRHVHAPATYKECQHHVLQTQSNKDSTFVLKCAGRLSPCRLSTSTHLADDSRVSNRGVSAVSTSAVFVVGSAGN